MIDHSRIAIRRSAVRDLPFRFTLPRPTATAVGAIAVALGIAGGAGATTVLPVAEAGWASAHQPGGVRSVRGGPGGPNGPEISKKSVERYANLLGLDPTQREAANALQQAYSEASQKISQEMQESFKAVQDEAQDGDHSAVLEKMPDIMRKHGEKRAVLQKSFLDDLKSLLTPKQEEGWPKLERLRRREGHGSGMGVGMVSGSGIDLTELLPKLKLPETETVTLEDTLEQYQQDLDKAIIEREKSRADRDGNEPGNVRVEFDMEKMKARNTEEREHAIKIRDLNRQYARRIGALLTDESRAKLDEEFKKRSFRQIFKEPYPAKLLGSALKFDDLDANQKKALLAEQETYYREVASLNEKWMHALDKAETEGKAGGMFMLPGMGSESEELTAARKARRELDDKTAQRVKTALNEKQREKLPKKNNTNSSIELAHGGPGVFVSQTMTSDEGDEDGETTSGAAIMIINSEER